MKNILTLIIAFYLSSCNDPDLKKQEIPACPMSAGFVEAEPVQEIGLNISNPVYLEMKSTWKGEAAAQNIYYSRFRMFNSGPPEIEILVMDIAKNDGTRICTKNISPEVLTEITSYINQAAICQSVYFQENHCSMAMIDPQTLTIIDHAGMQKVNLSKFALDGWTSFCHSEEVQQFEQKLSNLFSDLNLETDCTTP